MTIISPSVLAADFSDLATDLRRVADGGAQYLHLDVMDGAFVPNISFGPDLIASLRKKSELVFDVHLMIKEPIRFIDAFAKAGADLITIHLESTDDPDAAIAKIRENGLKVGVAISPATPVETLYPYLDRIDMALIMTVVPGFGGQKLIPETLDKVAAVRRYVNEHGLSTDIEVDGGLTAENVGAAIRAGANVIVAGSAIFRASDPGAVISAMIAAGN